MKKVVFIGLVGSSLLLNAGFMEDMASQMGGVLQGVNPNSQNNQNQTQLISQLTQLLNIDSKQAVGGTTALMALASSKMPKDNYNSLINSVPGLSPILSNSGGSLLGSVASAMGGESAVNSAFKALGIDNSTVSQFAPALLGIFKQYTSNENINLLSQAWSSFLPKK